MSEKEKKEEEIIKVEKEFDIKEIYTPLSVAKEEIWRRWNDPVLRKKVEDFLGGDIPEVFKDGPKTALFRYIATPNLEFKIFFDLAKLIDIEPIFVEFSNDKFCTVNHDKLYMGKMVFSKRNGNGNYITGKKIVIDLNKYDGKNIREIKTKWGEDFIDFHHRIFNKAYNGVKTFDAYEFKSNGESSYEVYLKFFSLFVCNGIFFEIYYNNNKKEKEFDRNVIIPAFNKIKEIFGVKPLIVPLIDHTDEDVFLQYYPEHVQDEIGIL